MRHARLRDLAGLTDIGRRRASNEDAIAFDETLGLALVADGMGGGNEGEVASATVVRSVRGDLRIAREGAPAEAASGPWNGPALVSEVVQRANQQVLAAAAREPKLQGMGTTLAMALLSERGIIVGHVGDSRVYRMRDGALAQLTRDHSVVNELVANGHLVPADAGRSKQSGVLTRAMGMPGPFKVDVCEHAVAPDDLYLVCSDGLTTMVPDEDIANLLREAGCDLRDTVQAAVDLANRRGGRDNVSVIVLRTA